ncbi:MAG TPA: hypothetical protein G4O10_06845 [Dehalococcoidia bacterium]|nr:hypothetical protein [Dehalococcoidia bacterium]
MRKKGIRVLLAVVLLLSVCLVTAVPAVAGGDHFCGHRPHFVVGAGEWEGINPYGVPIGGGFLVYGKEPDGGFMVGSYEIGPPAGSWYRLRINAIKIGELDGNPAAWFWGEVVAGEWASGLPYTGYKVGVIVDGGSPGRDVDTVYISTPLVDENTAKGIYESDDPNGLLYPNGPLFHFDIARGNIIIK